MKPFHELSKVLTLALTSAVLLTTSCKKDNDNANKPNDGVKLKKIENSVNNYTAFEYNSNGTVSKMITLEGTVTEVVSLTYQNGKLQSASSPEQALKFNYAANGQVDQVDMHPEGLQKPLAGYLKFNYQADVLNHVVTYGFIPNENAPVPLIKIAFEYFANGDVKAQKEYQYNWFTKAYVLSESTAYEYDTKENPLYAMGEIYQVAFEKPSKHNPVKATLTDKDNNLISTTTYTYTYNTNGYPAQAEKKVVAAGQANPTVSTIKYIY